MFKTKKDLVVTPEALVAEVTPSRGPSISSGRKYEGKR